MSDLQEPLRAPFPWFGGKRRVADLVWARLGDVDTYNEPFAGSLAVLLGRPHAPRVETVNDLDCYLANFWRALQAVPDEVAYWADGPVNEADLHSRHRWLVERGRRRVLRCARDPHYFDPKIAGWWVWGQCLWIGSGWCQSPRSVERNKGTRPALTHGNGITSERTASTRSGERPWMQSKRPAASRSGTSVGVHGKRFAGTGNGQGAGVHRRWQGGGQGGGSGVHAPRLAEQMPRISAEGGSISGVTSTPLTISGGLYDYLEQLAVRLRRVRVCCGDWKRVLTPSVTTYVGLTGVFLDPPYAHDLRERCYAEDHDISADVRAWAIEHGDDPKMRIALCGYEGEHDMPASWECAPWKAHGGYSRTERGVANRSRERIWFSPHCLKGEQRSIFDVVAEEGATA
ncbi:MAG TPA: DNA adenine methylase [Vicinamibacterales bacterium]